MAEEKVVFLGEEPKIELSVRYPLVALREGVVFAHTESILTFARPRSVAAIEEAVKAERNIVLVTQRRENTSDPQADDLYEVGVVASIERILKGDHEINALVHAINR